MWWRHKNKSHFWAIYRHRTQKQITPLDSWDQTESEKCILFAKFWILKIDLFWPFLTFLTWPWGQIWKLPLPLDSTSKITYITLSRDFYVVFLMMTSCDLTVTLTCTYFKHNTVLDFSAAVKKRFWESLGALLLIARSLWVIIRKHIFLTFDLTLTLHVTS